jgi:hypothetical protein
MNPRDTLRKAFADQEYDKLVYNAHSINFQVVDEFEEGANLLNRPQLPGESKSYDREEKRVIKLPVDV